MNEGEELKETPENASSSQEDNTEHSQASSAEIQESSVGENEPRRASKPLLTVVEIYGKHTRGKNSSFSPDILGNFIENLVSKIRKFRLYCFSGTSIQVIAFVAPFTKLTPSLRLIRRKGFNRIRHLLRREQRRLC
jgi:hypothetical protein